LSAGQRQDRASDELPELVARSALRWVAAPEAVNGTADKPVVGVAVWSRYDLTLLDELNAFAAAHPMVCVYVFDVDRVGGEVERFVPGVGSPGQTPVVGWWSCGVLNETGIGFAGRQLVHRLPSIQSGQLSE
jgi:hypothetical protein